MKQSIYLMLALLFNVVIFNGVKAEKPHLQTSKSAKKITKVPSSKRILFYSCKHVFSDPIKKDQFEITLNGTTITKGEVTFKIISYKNTLLFQEKFPSTDLLGDLEDVLNATQQVNTIKNRMAKFLDKGNFTSPATIGVSNSADDYADKAIWEDIKSDPTAIGFLYAHGYESNYGIAFSKKNRKVVQFFYSD